MAAINFPDSPTNGELFTVGDITWQWDGTVWRSGPAGPSAITTEGDLAVGDSSGEPSRLPIGTTGQILQSNGTTATWTAPAASGSMTLLSTTSLAGLTSVTVSNINQNYKDLRIEIDDIGFSGTKRLFPKNSSGAVLTGSLYYDWFGNNHDGTSDNGSDNIVLGLSGFGGGMPEGASVGTITNYSSSSTYSVFNFVYGPWVNFKYSAGEAYGVTKLKQSINELVFTTSSTFPTGSTLRIYGVN